MNLWCKILGHHFITMPKPPYVARLADWEYVPVWDAEGKFRLELNFHCLRQGCDGSITLVIMRDAAGPSRRQSRRAKSPSLQKPERRPTFREFLGELWH